MKRMTNAELIAFLSRFPADEYPMFESDEVTFVAVSVVGDSGHDLTEQINIELFEGAPHGKEAL